MTTRKENLARIRPLAEEGKAKYWRDLDGEGREKRIRQLSEAGKKGAELKKAKRK